MPEEEGTLMATVEVETLIMAAPEEDTVMAVVAEVDEETHMAAAGETSNDDMDKKEIRPHGITPLRGDGFVCLKHSTEDGDNLQELRVLTNQPYRTMTRYSCYLVNGCKFCTKAYGLQKATMNYGVAAFVKEGNIGITYYGIITYIIELNYADKGSVVLLKCGWASSALRGTKKDEFGIQLVNFNHLQQIGKQLIDEPYIYAWQARQVYYVPEDGDNEWHDVRSFLVRDTYELGDEDMEDGDIPVAPADDNEFHQPDLPNELYPSYRKDIRSQILHIPLEDAILSLSNRRQKKKARKE
ncbi:hypothetical protein ACQ4PT_071241 [Festuca glaucescens]